MKAEELMVGDWIQNPLGWKARVMSIKYINVIRDEWEWLFKIGINNDTFQSNLSEDEVLPIPLTPEILEKNEWCSRMNGTGEFYLKEPLVNAAIVTKTIMGFQMNHGFFSGLSIHFVHELQHALRLCGIEKEIVI